MFCILLLSLVKIIIARYYMKKKKEKLKKLSDEDYANYIMSLKDERPTKVIIPEKDKS